MITFTCQNCGTRQNINLGVEVVRCLRCRCLSHATAPYEPYGCRPDDDPALLGVRIATTAAEAD